MPIRKAIQDSFGLKDVMMDTLDTFQGDKFSYRSFEPSEGVPHMGSSRTSRIMAGLRYSNITSKKHWIQPAPTSQYLSPPSGRDETAIEVEQDVEPLSFEDPQPSDEVEALYKDSRRMEFGDYNYPVIDFRVPLWRLARRYGGTENVDMNNHHPILKRILKLDDDDDEEDEEQILLPREGCIDVVVQQGKGNYVLAEELEEEQETTIMPQPPSRKPTLTEIPRDEEGNPEPSPVSDDIYPNDTVTTATDGLVTCITDTQQQQPSSPTVNATILTSEVWKSVPRK